MTWLHAYLTVGVLCVIWNMRSVFFQTWLQGEIMVGRRWIAPFVLTVGVLAWPVGVIITVAYFVSRRMRRRS